MQGKGRREGAGEWRVQNRKRKKRNHSKEWEERGKKKNGSNEKEMKVS